MLGFNRMLTELNDGQRETIAEKLAGVVVSALQSSIHDIKQERKKVRPTCISFDVRSAVKQFVMQKLFWYKIYVLVFFSVFCQLGICYSAMECLHCRDVRNRFFFISVQFNFVFNRLTLL